MKILRGPMPQMSAHTGVTELVFLCRVGDMSVPGMRQFTGAGESVAEPGG